MAKTPPFLAHILELMRPLGGVTARAMFGGFGIYRNGRMFAILVDDELFFKVSDHSRAKFEQRGLKPFTYERKGKQISMSYFQAPAECLDESHVMVDWINQL